MKIASPDFAAPPAPCRRIRTPRRRAHTATVDACINASVDVRGGQFA
jgi:hypothetical protein